MNGNPTLEELLEVQRHLGRLAPAFIEKDWYVIRALAAIAAVDAAPFRLIFQGGTALSRAHLLTERMSEDIDFKIVSEQKYGKGPYKRLRERVTEMLLAAGFDFDPTNAAHRKTMYEYKYVVFQLPFPSVTGKAPELRPGIKIEMSAWPMRRPSIERPVRSFVAEAFGHTPEVTAIACADLSENVAEKFVALTRRAGAQLAGVWAKRDPTLVRHIYDMHMLSKHVDAATVAVLAAEIMKDDAESRGGQFPAYGEDPLRETQKAVTGIIQDSEFAKEYAAFVDRMVYGERVPFEAAVATVVDVGKRLA